MRLGSIPSRAIPGAKAAAAAVLLAAASGGIAAAQGAVERPADYVISKPRPDGIALREPATPVMENLVWLDDFLLIIITVIAVFVLGLMVWACVRYHEKVNPTPAKFTHNTVVEVVWTVVPVLILIVIAIPSLRLLFLQLEPPPPDLTIKTTGNQWFWSYEYPDDGISFDAFMVAKEDLAEYGYEEDEWLLATDQRMVVPVGQNVSLLVTGSDVIHNWAMPSFGIKMDAIPGRVNETWFRVEKPGIYFGQCSELCGKDHSYMPIVVEAMLPEAYDAWRAEQQAARGIEPGEARTELAAVE